MCERGSHPGAASGGIAALREAVDLYARGRRAGEARGAARATGVREELRDLRRLIDRLEMETASLVGDLGRCGEDEWQGHPSPSAWLSHECMTSATTAWNALVVGEQAAGVPRSMAAVREGAIGFAHLAVIARTAEWLGGAGGAGPFDEGFLLDRARERTVAELRRDAAHARHAADPRRFLREQVEQVEARFLELRAVEGGGMWLRGFLDAEGGATLSSALDPLSSPAPGGDPRDRGRRQADALVELCGRALDSGSLPDRGGQRPHLQVTVSLDSLLDRDGAPAATLQGGGPVPAETARRLGCDAAVSRVVFGPGSAVIEAGRAVRVVPASTRRALVARDGGCVWPGCGRPAAWCEGHHLRHWARGGTTDMDNLVLICRRHHFLCHEAGWTLLRTGDGVRAVAPLPRGPLHRARAPDPAPAA